MAHRYKRHIFILYHHDIPGVPILPWNCPSPARSLQTFLKGPFLGAILWARKFGEFFFQDGTQKGPHIGVLSPGGLRSGVPPGVGPNNWRSKTFAPSFGGYTLFTQKRPFNYRTLVPAPPLALRRQPLLNSFGHTRVISGTDNPSPV